VPHRAVSDGASTHIDGLKVIDLFTALRRLGVAPRTLSRAVGVDLDALNDPSTRVPLTTVERILDEAERRTGDRLIGLHAGQCAEPRGVLAYLVMSSPNLGDGLAYVEQFSLLVIDGIEIHLERSGATAALVFDREQRVLGAHRHTTDYLLMASLRLLRRAVGARLRLHAVHVRYADPTHQPELSEAFGCRVHSAAADCRLMFPVSDLRAPSRLANPLIAAQLRKFAAGLSTSLHAPTALRGRVADATRSLVAAGLRPDRKRVAKHLSLSHRPLHRRLTSEGITFKQLRDEVLREVVEALLTNPELTVETIASSVGFADTAAFSRAFKRWAGRSPRQHREQLA
jgi:AraC-like DNA-binding protein